MDIALTAKLTGAVTRTLVAPSDQDCGMVNDSSRALSAPAAWNALLPQSRASCMASPVGVCWG